MSLEIMTSLLQGLVVLVGVVDKFLHEIIVILQGDKTFFHFFILILNSFISFTDFSVLLTHDIIIFPQFLFLLIQLDKYIKHLIVSFFLISKFNSSLFKQCNISLILKPKFFDILPNLLYQLQLRMCQSGSH